MRIVRIPLLLRLVIRLSPMATVLTQELSLAGPQQNELPNEGVVRISVTLVQVDAVVTDKNGNHVTGLRPEDFEVLEDGRPQKITHFSYVLTQPTSPSTQTSRAEKNPFPTPPAHLTQDQVRRTIALVVDDLGMSFESMANVNGASRRFVDEQMWPGDLVAIIRTAAGMGALQQFTSTLRLSGCVGVPVAEVASVLSHLSRQTCWNKLAAVQEVLLSAGVN